VEYDSDYDRGKRPVRRVAQGVPEPSRLCCHHLRGNCAHGEGCYWVHAKADVDPGVIQCRYGSRCTSGHGRRVERPPLRVPSAPKPAHLAVRDVARPSDDAKDSFINDDACSRDEEDDHVVFNPAGAKSADSSDVDMFRTDRRDADGWISMSSPSASGSGSGGSRSAGSEGGGSSNSGSSVSGSEGMSGSEESSNSVVADHPSRAEHRSREKRDLASSRGICCHFLEGKCAHRDTCWWAHPALPGDRVSWEDLECRYGRLCRFRHGRRGKQDRDRQAKRETDLPDSAPSKLSVAVNKLDAGHDKRGSASSSQGDSLVELSTTVATSIDAKQDSRVPEAEEALRNVNRSCQVCCHFLEGTCLHGSTCCWAHPVIRSARARNAIKCRYGRRCPHQHGRSWEEEQDDEVRHRRSPVEERDSETEGRVTQGRRDLCQKGLQVLRRPAPMKPSEEATPGGEVRGQEHDNTAALSESLNEALRLGAQRADLAQVKLETADAPPTAGTPPAKDKPDKSERICCHWLEGRCANGDACHYQHPAACVASLARDYTECRYGPSCHHWHGWKKWREDRSKRTRESKVERSPERPRQAGSEHGVWVKVAWSLGWSAGSPSAVDDAWAGYHDASDGFGVPDSSGHGSAWPGETQHQSDTSTHLEDAEDAIRILLSGPWHSVDEVGSRIVIRLSLDVNPLECASLVCRTERLRSEEPCGVDTIKWEAGSLKLVNRGMVLQSLDDSEAVWVEGCNTCTWNRFYG